MSQGALVPVERPQISERHRAQWLRQIAFYEAEEKIEHADGDDEAAQITRQTIETIRQWIEP